LPAAGELFQATEGSPIEEPKVLAKAGPIGNTLAHASIAAIPTAPGPERPTL
jgi:hypothetical protein